MRSFAAVLFDLYDTLVEIPIEDYIATKQQMADILGVDHDSFLNAWRQFAKLAAMGSIPTIQDRLTHVAGILNIDVTADAIAQAASLEQELQEKKVRRLPGCDNALRQSSKLGLQIGLVTNTSIASQNVLRILDIDRWFSTVVFSFEAQLLKPDRAIYQLAAERLGVPPESCLFVGDGNDMELNGAKSAGMLAIKVATPRDQNLSGKQSTDYDYEIKDLYELPALTKQLVGHGS